MLALIEARIRRNRVYPAAARWRGIEGAVKASVSVDAEGRLTGERIVRSSGSTILDQAALELLRAIFPITNPLFHGFIVEVRVVYRLEGGG